ncbi:unnamed protein product [Mycena citricolor]|uniref:Enoyl-CoA hydratase n=1 Tax=Mycena citricolor TaxID=2018698 RepID=A0AAD2H2L6_9AGAR|nr:unnamed protein product [Mycena citricolor]CAK5266989.1 unnamed protein product [Mycena citricolor]
MLISLLSFLSLVIYSLAARYPAFGTLQTSTSAGVMNVVINNTFSPINIFDMHVQADLANLIEELQSPDTDVRAVVFSSANKEFFIAHIDINYFLPGYQSVLPFNDPGLQDMTFPVALLWNVTQLPQATIAMVEGRTRGIGNEFIMSCDMRFAVSSPSVLLSQLETSFGLMPGAGGGLYLAQTIGRGRAFEYVLSSADIDADTAAQIGWINKAFPTSQALHTYVQNLAQRIALFPRAAIVGAKVGINRVSRPPREVIVKDAQNKFITATNNQSFGEIELDYGLGKDLIQFF